MEAAKDSAKLDRPSKTRRSHNKSRNGCYFCKQRKIKCNEVKPICGNCAHLSIQCDYPGSGRTPPLILPRRRGRPPRSGIVLSATKSPGDSLSPLLPVTSSESRPALVESQAPELSLEAPLHLPWDTRDLELLYHYTTAVAPGGPENRLWHDHVPRLAFRCHYLLHLVLAISALHLSRHDRNRAAELEECASSHLSIGLRQVTKALPGLNERNCAELYVAAVLICTCTFAKPPEPKHLLVVAGGNDVAWWELFRAVRIVIGTIGHDNLFAMLADNRDSETSAVFVGHTNQPGQRVTQASVPVGEIDWETALGSLSLLANQDSTERKPVYMKTLGMLEWCFHETFGASADPKFIPDIKFETIMAWLYVLDDDYVCMLKENDPISMALLAHFAVLLQLLECVWFLEGWPAHILQGVSGALSPSQMHWITWPRMQIERIKRIMH